MHIVVLGRQPALSKAELEAVYGAGAITPLLDRVLLLDTDHFNINRFGGVKKAGQLLFAAKHGEKTDQLERYLLSLPKGKITLGFSYFTKDSLKLIQKKSLKLKNLLKTHGYSVRLVPQADAELSTAVSHHNKLGLSPNKVELIFASTKDQLYVAASTGAQNITAYAARDQKRPKRDALVGMLPPKLAQIIVNLAVGGTERNDTTTILDPFCGTGVLLQEASLMGYATYGTDTSPKMIDYSKTNLAWLSKRFARFGLPPYRLETGDATSCQWQPPIDVVASETYLGQPFSGYPSPTKLGVVKANCASIILGFLKNLSSQIAPGTRLCLAVPAWRIAPKRFAHLNLLDSLEELGYNVIDFKHAPQKELLYIRDNQFVGRELLVLIKT
jgi:tRNA (guanine10-N2)-dimethyltransferase